MWDEEGRLRQWLDSREAFGYDDIMITWIMAKNRPDSQLHGDDDGQKSIGQKERQPLKYLMAANSHTAGGFGGICTTLCGHPLDTLKVRMQAMPMEYGGAWSTFTKIIRTEGTTGLYKTAEMKNYSGFVDCAVKLYREGGIKNFYVGTCITIIRDVPAGGAYFGVYDLIMRYFTYHYAETAIWQPIIAGGFAGMANWLVAMPADVLKSRLQISPIGKYPHGTRSLLPTLLREEGAWTLYRGVIPIMIRAVPANAACFLGIEIAMRFMDSYISWL